MPEPLSARDFNSYYVNTFMHRDGVTYYVYNITEEGNVHLKFDEGYTQTRLERMGDILDYVGIYPQAGYRQLEDNAVSYISFRRDGMKKGPTTNSIQGGVNPARYAEQIFNPKFIPISVAKDRALKGLPSVLSYNMAIIPSGTKLFLYWKTYLIGRITKNGTAILSKEYEFLKSQIKELPIGDFR